MDLVVYKRFFHISAKVTMFVIIANGGREINLPPGQYMLGRPNLTSKDQCPPDHIKIDVECNDDPKISRNHAVLCVDEDSLTIRDYGSKNGLAVREAAPRTQKRVRREKGLPQGCVCAQQTDVLNWVSLSTVFSIFLNSSSVISPLSRCSLAFSRRPFLLAPASATHAVSKAARKNMYKSLTTVFFRARLMSDAQNDSCANCCATKRTGLE